MEKGLELIRLTISRNVLATDAYWIAMPIRVGVVV